MIHFYVGKPRNGKSLRAMMRIWDALTTSQCYVVTNMVIDYDVLQHLLIMKGFAHVYARRRIRMLDDVQTKNFWLYREHDLILDKPEGYTDSKSDTQVDYAPIFRDARFYEDGTAVGGAILTEHGNVTDGKLKGTFYVIDEVHTHWRARGWQGTPRHVDFYNSQHGKLNDTVIFITQNTKLVDSNFLRLAQDFTYCRNHRLEKHGRFRGDNKFTASTYPGPVSNANEVTLNVEEFKLDLQLASCYDTSAGVGMPGGGAADAGFRAKGVPLKMIWVGLAAVLVMVFCLFQWIIPKITSKYIAPAIEGKPSAVTQSLGVGKVTKADEKQGAKPVGIPRGRIASYEVPPEDTTPENPLYVTGWVMQGGRYYVQLSNGDRIKEAEGSILAVNSTRVVMRDGTTYRVRGRPITKPKEDNGQPLTDDSRVVPRGTTYPKVEYTEQKTP